MTPANASVTVCDRATDDLLDEMVRVIVREIDPERIILFGSRARGDARPDSDVDLLIVRERPNDHTQSSMKLEVNLWSKLSAFPVSTDILIYTPDDMAKWRQSKNHLIGRATREGRVLYERPRD